MHDRSAPIVVTPRACPFVALDGDRDRRLDTPDPLHRCFAEQIPRARSITHQADFCLAPTFTGCPIFQDWATRAAAEPLVPTVPVPAVRQPATDGGITGGTPTVPVVPPVPGASGRPHGDQPRDDARSLTQSTRLSRAREAQAADEELVATRSVPAYRAVPAPVPPTTSVPVARPNRVEQEPVGPGAGIDGIDAGDDIPVIRSMPVPRIPPPPPIEDDDWAAPPPWLRQPPPPVWIAEAVPPPDALADIGTQPVRRSRPPEPHPTVIAEAGVPEGEPDYLAAGAFADETTGMPLEMLADTRSHDDRVRTTTLPDPRIAEATGTGTQPTDPGVSAELAAARYRADVAAGLVVDDEMGSGPEARAASRGRRVPIDVQAAASLGAQSQARPTVRSTGSREWEGPRRFEAYAATQRRGVPTSIIVGGSAIALVVVLLGVFLLPGLLMGGGPAATATPGPTSDVAAVVATDTPADPTTRPDRTEAPERTPKPKTYTVKSGDTLIKIAKRFKVRVDRLTCLNKIKNPDNVAVGRTLTIPPKGYRCPSD